jgi:hypothetical protein
VINQYQKAQAAPVFCSFFMEPGQNWEAGTAQVTGRLSGLLREKPDHRPALNLTVNNTTNW